ncbi:MAG: hypothetical protein JSS07_11355 [Proteobacteria bacterium]|nr:hypothetical protein [Pseudomonadota bacterium]
MLPQQKSKIGVFFAIFNLFKLFFYVTCLQAAQTPLVSYKISPSSDEGNCLQIEAHFKETDKEIFLRVPTFVKNMDITSATNHVTVEKNANSEVIKIPNDAGSVLHIKYNYCMANPTRNIFYPIIEKNFIHSMVDPLLITPQVQDAVEIEMDFSAFSDIQVATSYNVNKKIFRINTLISDFRNAVLCLGKLDIDKITLNGNNLFVVSNGTWPYFEQSPFHYIKAIFKQQRQFWQDHAFAHYVIFLIKQNPPAIPKIFVGRHWHNAFSGLLPEDSSAKARVLYTLSHEAFHAWLGGKMQAPQPQGSLQWFFEGFNDFYGLLLAYKSGMISLKDYIKIYNDLIMDYTLSPLKFISNNDVKAHFNLGNNFNQIAQLRGHIIAKQLRDKFNQKPQNKVDMAMKALYQQYQQENWPYLTKEKIDATFNDYVGVEWQSVQKQIDGESIVFAENAFYPFARLQKVKIIVPDFGFNVKQMLLDGHIIDIQKESNAYLAGLREGQRVKSYQMDFKTIAQTTLQLADSDKIISFLPNSTTKEIPQYVIIKGDIFEKYLKNNKKDN